METRIGLTLVELVVVLLVLAAVSGLLVPLFSGTLQHAHVVATEQTLVRTRDAVCNYWRDTKHVPLDGITTVATESNRFHTDWLFANPETGDASQTYSIGTQIGWRGPYMVGSTGNIQQSGSPFLIDAWNQPIEIQDVDPAASTRDVRIVSGGVNGSVDIPSATATAALTAADIGDDIYVTLSLH